MKGQLYTSIVFKAPIPFYKTKNYIFKSLMDKFLVYFDNIQDKHIVHLYLIFEVLKEENLYVNFKKCSFLTNSLMSS